MKTMRERFDEKFPLQSFSTEDYPGYMTDFSEFHFKIWQNEQTNRAMFRIEQLQHFIEQELKKEREEIVEIIDNQIKILNPVEQKEVSDVVVNITMSIVNKILVNIINTIKNRT